MSVRTWIEGWPAYRQLAGGDLLGRGAAVKSPASSRLVPRTATGAWCTTSAGPPGS
jgi:formate dehydrogenase major subunit